MKAAAQAAEPAVGDAYLVARARDGYLDAYELLVQRHSAMAYRVALRLTGNHHDAQDVAQEALIAAWENLDRFRGGSSFSTWLYQIVTRRALNKVTRAAPAARWTCCPTVPTRPWSPPTRPSATWRPTRSPTRCSPCRSRSGR